MPQVDVLDFFINNQNFVGSKIFCFEYFDPDDSTAYKNNVATC